MKDIAIPQAPLRSPAKVMRLARMGQSFPTRLCFLRVVLRRLSQEAATLQRPVWHIDDGGYGHAVYTLALGGHDYSLIAVSQPLASEDRSDRVIASAWDTSFVLYDGRPDAAEIARLVATVPRQEAARFTERDLILSRANKSVRLFEHVVTRLRAGQQPDRDLINRVGYLLRTTAVYGNGKFGIADHARLADRPGLDGPFAAEMLVLWLIRAFSHDLVEHMGNAPLDRDIRRHLGVGNATGLGMAPFLVSHPVLLNNWILARETALARVRVLGHLTDPERERLARLHKRAAQHLRQWHPPATDDTHSQLISEWDKLGRAIEQGLLDRIDAVEHVLTLSEPMSLAMQELTIAWLIEPFGHLVDDLAEGTSDRYGVVSWPVPDTETLLVAIETYFDWALAIDFDAPDAQRRFWYVSEDKLEPRLGDRFTDPGADRESALDIARRIKALYRALQDVTDLRAFRRDHPEHELAIRRTQTVARHPFSEIRDNLIAGDCAPIDMLRAKLSFFGATKFDPKSDRWTRVTLAQGAPLPDELGKAGRDDWWLPVLPI